MSYQGGGGRGGGRGAPGGRGGYGGRGRGDFGGGRGYDSGGRGGSGGRGRGSHAPAQATDILTVQLWNAAAAYALSGEVQKRLALSTAESSSKATGPPPRPGKGTIGRPCVVRANHFMVQLTKGDFYRYDVAISPEVTSRRFNRVIMSELVKKHKSNLANRVPAYDGKKSLYTAGPLPFDSRTFEVKIVENDRDPPRERLFKVTLKKVSQVDTHQLKEFLSAQQSDMPQDCLQVLDVVMQAAAPTDYVVIGRSYFSHTLGADDLGAGLEYWRGYYQSLRPTQMGLSLNVDSSARPFYQPVVATEFACMFLDKDATRGLTEPERLKALRGATVETSYKGFKKHHKVNSLSIEGADRVIFASETGPKSVSQYFLEKYNIRLSCPRLPCIISGQGDRAVQIPMELCKLADNQRYMKKLSERQVSNMLRATCKRPHEREQIISKICRDNNYGQNFLVAKEFGLKVDTTPLSIEARVLPVPRLKYHESGRESMVTPGQGQWNMIDKKMYDGARINFWACLNFSRLAVNMCSQFCDKLVEMCVNKGMVVNPDPVYRLQTARPEYIEKALADAANAARQANKALQLLIIILPEHSGSYGKIKRICETDLGVISQCCQPKNVSKMSPQYMENVSLKINVKVGGRNIVLNDAINRCIPLLTDVPTIIFGADVTHAQPGEDSTPSVAAVVASMDWPEVTKYRSLVSAQGVHEEIIQDLYKIVNDPKRGPVHSGMVRELLIAFKRSTGVKPSRIIFYRDGVSEGQFAQVLLHEMDAIRRACASLEEGYAPRVTFVVVQKRHHTRLFPTDRNMMDRSGNILPGTVVDTKICHPSQFDFYLCSHAGIQGTGRPTHYHVLYDENYFTADLLQLLTNSLCYTYARCTKSVSVVPPCYYAHLAAFRARYYMEPDVSEGGSGGRGAGGSGGPVAYRALPKIQDSVKDVMFFCQALVLLRVIWEYRRLTAGDGGSQLVDRLTSGQLVRPPTDSGSTGWEL